MSRPQKAMPKYRYHISGQAVVTLGGKDFYLGQHESPESHAKYLALVGEYQRNGLKAPQVESHQAERGLTIAGLIADFHENGLQRITPSVSHRLKFANVANLLELEYGDDPASSFGPRKLEEIRSLFIASGNCRNYANELTRKVCRIFKWAVSRELIDPNQLVALNSLDSLKRGEVHDNEPRQPANLEDVNATHLLLDKAVADMVGLQLATSILTHALGIPAHVNPCSRVQRPLELRQ